MQHSIPQSSRPKRRRAGIPYTFAEDCTLLAFLSALPSTAFINGRKVYEVMEAAGALPGRTGELDFRVGVVC